MLTADNCTLVPKLVYVIKVAAPCGFSVSWDSRVRSSVFYILDYTSRARWPEGLIVLRRFKNLRYTQTDPNLVTLDGVTIGKT